jgi:hypothetical protein
VCEGQLYTMYVDRGTCFSKDDFWAFTSLLDCSHETIHLKWVADLNHSEEAQLAFVVGGEQHWAAHEWLPVSRTEFAQIITHLKTELRGKTLTNALFMFFFFFFFLSFTLCRRFLAAGFYFSFSSFCRTLLCFCRSLLCSLVTNFFFLFNFFFSFVYFPPFFILVLHWLLLAVQSQFSIDRLQF